MILNLYVSVNYSSSPLVPAHNKPMDRPRGTEEEGWLGGMPAHG